MQPSAHNQATIPATGLYELPSLAGSRRTLSPRTGYAVAALVEACYRSDDYREGQAAFGEKRSPHFRGV